MIRKIFPILFSFFILSAHAEPFLLVSGFDDVLRQAENQNLFRAGLKLFKRDETFTGMAELYAGLSEDAPPEAKFFLISGISSFFEERIESFLKESRYPKPALHLRSWTTEWSVEKFKVDSLRKILGGDKSRKFIVIFDNSGASLEMTKTIPEAFPGQVLKVYLRETVKRPETLGSQQFITTWDIARSEMLAGRLKESAVHDVAHAILRETDLNRLLPTYMYCPRDYEACHGGASSLAEECAAIQKKIRDLCASRSTAQ